MIYFYLDIHTHTHIRIYVYVYVSYLILPYIQYFYLKKFSITSLEVGPSLGFLVSGHRNNTSIHVDTRLLHPT